MCRRLPTVVAILLLAGAPAHAAFPTGNSTQTLESGGRMRSYLVHVPASYDGSTAVPLVLDFHGLGSNAVQQRAISGMVAISDREGFLLVHPDGIDNAWNAGMCCSTATDDVEFVRALVATVSSQANVEASRVYATGLSNGGAMSSAWRAMPPTCSRRRRRWRSPCRSGRCRNAIRCDPSRC
jgi:polyhydroxybutyrate depolymerase